MGRAVPTAGKSLGRLHHRRRRPGRPDRRDLPRPFSPADPPVRLRYQPRGADPVHPQPRRISRRHFGHGIARPHARPGRALRGRARTGPSDPDRPRRGRFHGLGRGARPPRPFGPAGDRGDQQSARRSRRYAARGSAGRGPPALLPDLRRLRGHRQARRGDRQRRARCRGSAVPARLHGRPCAGCARRRTRIRAFVRSRADGCRCRPDRRSLRELCDRGRPPRVRHR